MVLLFFGFVFSELCNVLFFFVFVILKLLIEACIYVCEWCLNRVVGGYADNVVGYAGMYLYADMEATVVPGCVTS